MTDADQTTRDALAEVLAAEEWPDLTWEWIQQHSDPSRFYRRADALLASDAWRTYVAEPLARAERYANVEHGLAERWHRRADEAETELAETQRQYRRWASGVKTSLDASDLRTVEEIPAVLAEHDRQVKAEALLGGEWLSRRVNAALDSIRYAEGENIETELDLIAFAEDVLNRAERVGRGESS